jgi:hypothetical protein
MPAEANPLGTAPESRRRVGRLWGPAIWLVLLGATAGAQVCQTAADIDPPARASLEVTARRYFEMSARGDSAGLKQNSIATVAANFAGIEEAVKENQAAFTGAQAAARPPFLLTSDGPEPLARAEFLCGVFGKLGQTKDSAVFVLNSLPPGKYGVVIFDLTGAKSGMTLTLVLQQAGTEWKLAGFFARSSQAAGHDAGWFTQRARDFKGKAQNRNAWLYFRQAVPLSSPVDFMSTLATDKLYDEIQAMQPADLPANGVFTEISAGGKSYRLTEIFPLAVGDDLDVVVKYQAADISDSVRTFQENTVVVKALVVKFPELRDAFAGVVARAVDPSGRDYGTLLLMKDLK